MRLLLVTVLTLSHWLFSFNSAFTFTTNTCVKNGIRKSTHLKDSLAEVEALLAKARALRVDAESAEKDLHKNLVKPQVLEFKIAACKNSTHYLSTC